MRNPNATSYLLPAAFSLALHLAAIAVLAWGWESAPLPRQAATPNYVEARLVKLNTQAPRKQQAKPQKVVDLAAKRRAKAAQEAAAKKAREQKLARDKAAKEKAAKDKTAKEKAAADKALQEKLAQEEVRRRREAELFEQLEEEDAMLSEQQAEQATQSYVAAIRNRIEMNWSRPPSSRKGMSCELLIQLVPTGRVVDVKVVKSSGNTAFDRAAEQAVRAAERFPELAGMDAGLFERSFRQLRLHFQPEDLRL